jgi:alkanesulfonate monooxygenase SsuD/methylene tetrahydromethanopterin reductase-like flavin-dependent oxidoreductase (luciferase family)
MDRLEAALPVLRAEVGEGIPILVAGSGEHRLLRIVARHADLCNLSMPAGDTLTVVSRRLQVLNAHCRSVGRDYSPIRKSYKALLALDDDSPGDAASGRIGGGAAQVWAGALAFLDAGIDELIVQIAACRTGAWLLSKVLRLLDYAVMQVSRERTSLTAIVAGLAVVVLSTAGAGAVVVAQAL